MVQPIHRSKTFQMMPSYRHLSKRRGDGGQPRFGISEGSFEHHKVGSSLQIARVLLGWGFQPESNLV